ncbi:hypothetical protein Xgly_13360 [Xanthomonas citri pv. glycines]|uniref:Uncharacterized protein n=1 Tax=Xanthomonas campestris pv. glycines TaxID=473421 RepID=A0AAX0I324_XANCG|nr:hypothetical protein [Xanthomonas citri]ARV21112.1 hypothetical protein A9D66_00455 [Xanthomonas citri pv. glycines str. 12-2]EWC50106.1 MFS transporter [Xanthomonas citri pv. glycines str. 8ra]OEY91140.1 hypothetical protein BIY41_00460 [Xanthomonas citri pv. glycines]OOX03141.1 hypothetical protein Xgly_13360 [Xanthomonas citri pv. glycines]
MFPLLAAQDARIALADGGLGRQGEADSPKFSALAARACSTAIIGSALSMQKAIGLRSPW